MGFAWLNPSYAITCSTNNAAASIERSPRKPADDLDAEWHSVGIH